MVVLAIGLILVGVFFLVVAAIGTLRLPDVFSRSHAVSLTDSLGAICVLALFIVGLLFSMLHHGAGQKKGIHKDDATVSATALIRCMIATSISDGHLDDREIKTIAKIYTQLTGSAMGEQTIKETAEYMESEGTDILNELANIKSILDADLKSKIIKASLFILAADGVVAEDEEYVLEAIRKGLGISKMKFNDMKRKFFAAKGLA